jgi:chemotaxis protein CheD
MVKKLRLQQEAGVAEREQALARQTAEARAERLAKARARVELFSAPAGGNAAKPRVELFGATAPAASTNTGGARPAGAKPRIELFGAARAPETT